MRTYCRTRPYGNQKLGGTFHQKEHTKPLFNSLEILTVQNLFKYHCISEIFKIMKFRCPYPLYKSIKISSRDSSLTIILPDKTNTFLYKGSLLWNTIHKKIVRSDTGLEVSVAVVKNRTKNMIMECQSAEDKILWTDKNFELSHDVIHSTTQIPRHNSQEASEEFIDIIS